METPRTTACPKCGAAVRPDADWCGQCYESLRPVPAAPDVAAAPAVAASPAVQDPLTSPLLSFLPEVVAPTAAVPAAVTAAELPRPAAGSTATWPCTQCQTVNALEASVCTACGSSFLAAVREDNKPLLVLPVVGDLGALSRPQRLLLALAAVAMLLLPLAAITLLLTESPPAQGPGTPTVVISDAPAPPPETPAAN